jgi:parallel beta-helix repeat protein
VNQSDRQVPLDAGCVIIVNSKNITVSDLTLTNNYDGVCLAYTNDSIIQNVTARNNADGILLSHLCQRNKIIDNILSDNRDSGITLSYDSNDNLIYHNTIAFNQYQAVLGLVSTNVWDSGSEGNYWSNWNPPDADKDKIGDLPYVFDENNTDRYPLIYPFECFEPGYVCSPDLNRDRVVNIVDVTKVARAFRCKPGDSNWSAIADMDLNEIINIVDVSKVAKDYGKTV